MCAIRVTPWSLCLVLFLGCSGPQNDGDADADTPADGGDADGPEGDAGSDSGADGDADGDSDADLSDSSASDSSVTLCTDVLLGDETFAVLPNVSLGTQIHAAAQFDGEAVWMTYNVPEAAGTGGFDVWAVRIGCDGQQVTEPFQVNTTLAPNDVDPAIVMGDQSVLFVWQSDTGVGDDNMQTFFRIFGRDGTPIMAEDRRLLASRAGVEQHINAFMPSQAALPDGAFAITAAWGLVDAMAFQVFVQRITAAGDLDGNAVDAYFEENVDQTYPALGANDHGELFVAYVRSEGDDDGHVVFKTVDDGAAEPEQVVSGTAPSSGADIAIPAGDTAVRYLALHERVSGSTVHLLDMGQPEGSRPAVELGNPGEVDHSAKIALDTAGSGAIAWYRAISGIRNNILVAGFRRDGDDVITEAETLIDITDPAAPYQPALTHVVGDIYFVAWSEGVSPNFVINGRFVTVR